MKKTLLVTLLAIYSYGYDVTVSIIPQKEIVEKIGGNLVNVNTMVEPGASPHNYEPKPKQMVKLANSKIYFTIGVEFEDVWLEKFKGANKNLTFVATDANIEKIDMVAHSHHDKHEEHADHDHDEDKKHDHEKEIDHDEHHDHEEHADHDHDEHEHKGKDPHVWTSAKNFIIIGENVYKALSKYDPKNSETYKKNFENFKKELEETDKEIAKILAPLKGKSFAVYHPSWGYFAKDYSLKQVAIEIEGKSPKAKETLAIIKELKEEGIKTLFTQPEFSKKSAEVIAKEIDGKVVGFSPLSEGYKNNLLNFATAIKQGYSK